MEYVAIPRKRCDTILKENKFQNTKNVYSQWKEEGLIKQNSKSGIGFKVKIGDVGQVDCLHIIIEKPLEKVIPYVSKAEAGKKKSKHIAKEVEADVAGFKD